MRLASTPNASYKTSRAGPIASRPARKSGRGPCGAGSRSIGRDAIGVGGARQSSDPARPPRRNLCCATMRGSLTGGSAVGLSTLSDVAIGHPRKTGEPGYTHLSDHPNSGLLLRCGAWAGLPESRRFDCVLNLFKKTATNKKGRKKR